MNIVCKSVHGFSKICCVLKSNFYIDTVFFFIYIKNIFLLDLIVVVEVTNIGSNATFKIIFVSFTEIRYNYRLLKNQITIKERVSYAS